MRFGRPGRFWRQCPLPFRQDSAAVPTGGKGTGAKGGAKGKSKGKGEPAYVVEGASEGYEEEGSYEEMPGLTPGEEAQGPNRNGGVAPPEGTPGQSDPWLAYYSASATPEAWVTYFAQSCRESDHLWAREDRTYLAPNKPAGVHTPKALRPILLDSGASCTVLG